MKDRSRELEMLHETLQILEQGFYEKNGRKVQLKLSRSEMEEAKVIMPNDVWDTSSRPEFEPPFVMGRCVINCENRDSFAVARERAAEKHQFGNNSQNVLVLNMANPVNPGGGVRRGAKAQEEDLCRTSSLLLSLEGKQAKEYYKYNKSLHTHMGSDALMITPQVEIIRDENGELLDDTVIVSVVTCAAPMAIYGKEGLTNDEYEDMIYERMTGLMKCTSYHGYRKIVLGAWGCGAFGNDAAFIADLFDQVLKEMTYNRRTLKDLFSRVDFAVLDRTRDQYNFKQFHRKFTYDNFYSV